MVGHEPAILQLAVECFIHLATCHPCNSLYVEAVLQTWTSMYDNHGNYDDQCHKFMSINFLLIVQDAASHRLPECWGLPPANVQTQIKAEKVLCVWHIWAKLGNPQWWVCHREPMLLLWRLFQEAPLLPRWEEGVQLWGLPILLWV